MPGTFKKGNKVFISLVVFCAGIVQICLPQIINNEQTIRYSGFMLLFFSFLTFLFVLLGNYVSKLSPEHIHLAFLVTQVIRMLFGFGFLGYILLSLKPSQPEWVAGLFIFWYLVSALVEIKSFLSNLRPDFLQRGEHL